ncbi:MAG: hypothetical protein NZ895_03055 [Archaeoglobaceae archaeon]|nr:hypothetical protein [Archaeoglobaceae archaeon]MCX8152143.1 hypothetical protein [Archaeoglobaceae archaeon]MDW8013579.1 hypothetical protein [Archaeoglobaceae archaeon]
MRPIGVSLIALFILVSGIFYIIASFAMLTAKEESLKIAKEEISKILNVEEEDLEKIYILSVLVLLFFGFLYFLSSYGLFTMKNWGRVLTVVICGLEAIYSTFFAFINPFFIFELTICILIIWYLTKKDIRDLFTKSIEEKILKS